MAYHIQLQLDLFEQQSSKQVLPTESRIVFTYGLSSMTRKQATVLAEQSGYLVETSVTRKSNVLVVGTRRRTGESRKLSKARLQNLKIIDEDTFLAAINPKSANYS